MKKSLLLFILFLICSFFACERKCDLKPIPKNIFSLNHIERVAIFHHKKEVDSVILVETIDDYVKTSKKSPTIHRECEHVKYYQVTFKNDNITVIIRKNELDSLFLELYAFGSCGKTVDNLQVTEKEISQNREYVFERKTNCENEKIKRITFSGYIINSITTSDNKVWIKQ